MCMSKWSLILALFIQYVVLLLWTSTIKNIHRFHVYTYSIAKDKVTVWCLYLQVEDFAITEEFGACMGRVEPDIEDHSTLIL